jgi:hypothetical protein
VVAPDSATELEHRVNINKALDKAWETKSFKEIAKAPVAALEGVTESDAKMLKEMFNVVTIEDLANLKYVRWAQAIVTLAAVES